MKKFVLVVLFLLLTVVQAFPCVQSIEATTENVGINIGGTWGRVFFSDLSTKSIKQREVEIMGKMQEFLDERMPLSSLTLDEPTKLEDPAQPGFFWSDVDGKLVDNPLNATHITGRSCIVTNVQWNEDRQTFLMTIRVVR